MGVFSYDKHTPIKKGNSACLLRGFRCNIPAVVCIRMSGFQHVPANLTDKTFFAPSAVELGVDVTAFG
jgi:hypothetical protein